MADKDQQTEPTNGAIVDPVQQAIKDAEASDGDLLIFGTKLATGKFIQMGVPADFDIADAACMVRAVLDLHDQFARERAKKALVLVRGQIPRA